MAKGQGNQANGQPKRKTNQIIPYEKLMTQNGNTVLIIQGYGYSKRQYSGQNYYTCIKCRSSKLMVYLENDVIVKSKCNFQHTKNHGPLKDAEIKKYRYHYAKYAYFKDKENFEKSTKENCEEILKNYSLESLGFSTKSKFASAIYECKKWVRRTRSLPETSDNEEDDDNKSEISDNDEDEIMPGISNQSSNFQEIPQADDIPSESEVSLPQVKIEEYVPVPFNFPQVKIEGNLPENSNVPLLHVKIEDNLSENSIEVPLPQVQNHNVSFEKLKFFVNEINESLLPSNGSSSNLLFIKSTGDVRFYLSKISELLANSNNSMPGKFIGKAKFFVSEISELLNKNGEGLVSIKDFEDIKFYMKKISKLMDENVDKKQMLGSVEIPIFID